MEAYNADGSLAGIATMTPTQNVAQTLTIEGSAIAFVRIHCPAGRDDPAAALLLRRNAVQGSGRGEAVPGRSQGDHQG